jgi:arachidonate 15-lipoxygenase
MFGTQYSNQIVTKGQMARGGDFETIFSFTHDGMCKLFEESYETYDIRVIDPAQDAAHRAIDTGLFDTPARANREAHFEVFYRHALRYLRLYYASDAALQHDQDFCSWVRALDEMVPNGIRAIIGNEITIERSARLIAALIYMATVEHEVLGTGLWNYQMWTDVQPVRVYSNGQREPVDVYQRLVNANFNLNVSRAPLVQDFSYLAVDERGAGAFREFKEELEALQARLDTEPFAHWKVYPKNLEANINA